MNRLLADGVELDRMYAHSVCSPSRSALHSGRFATHVNIDNSGPSFANTGDVVSGFQGVSRGMTLISEKLKAAGYSATHVGKASKPPPSPRLDLIPYLNPRAGVHFFCTRR